MEEIDLAAVVVTRDCAALLDGTLQALERELAAAGAVVGAAAGVRAGATAAPGSDAGVAPGEGSAEAHSAPRPPCCVAARWVVDSASRDGTPERALARGWGVLRLDPSAATTAAAAREAARRQVRARRILFVDGDVAVEPGFLAAAGARLDADGTLAGVGGELRFDEGHGAPAAAPHPPREAPLLAALALYRADVLEAAGGFVPWLESEEDADLGLRLRRAGYRLLVLQPGGVHRSGPRGGLRETLRRYRAGLYFGQGRVLRLRWGSPLFGATLRRQALYLAVAAAWLAAAGLVAARPEAWPAPAVAAVALALLMTLRKGGPGSAIAAILTWHVMAWGLFVGLVRPPRARAPRVLAVDGGRP